MIRREFLTALVGATLAAACNRFDDSQVPVVSVGHGLQPEISWSPSPAYQLSVYEGDKDLDGIGVLWSLSGGTGYENALKSPVRFGVPPPGSDYRAAPPLVAGKTYTVTIFRADERGGGEGFTNTRHRYVGVKTFVATE